jgi:hypothetical protein
VGWIEGVAIVEHGHYVLEKMEHFLLLQAFFVDSKKFKIKNGSKNNFCIQIMSKK